MTSRWRHGSSIYQCLHFSDVWITKFERMPPKHGPVGRGWLYFAGRSFVDASRIPPLMATILLVCFGNAIGDWKMQMGIEKSTRLSSWLIAGPWSCKNDSSCGAWSLGSRIWWENHARPHYVAKLKVFSYLAIYDLAAEHFATKSVQHGQGDTNKMYH